MSAPTSSQTFLSNLGHAWAPVSSYITSKCDAALCDELLIGVEEYLGQLRAYAYSVDPALRARFDASASWKDIIRDPDQLASVLDCVSEYARPAVTEFLQILETIPEPTADTIAEGEVEFPAEIVVRLTELLAHTLDVIQPHSRYSTEVIDSALNRSYLQRYLKRIYDHHLTMASLRQYIDSNGPETAPDLSALQATENKLLTWQRYRKSAKGLMNRFHASLDSNFAIPGSETGEGPDASILLAVAETEGLRFLQATLEFLLDKKQLAIHQEIVRLVHGPSGGATPRRFVPFPIDRSGCT